MFVVGSGIIESTLIIYCNYNAESVDSLMNDTHELGGSNVVVDRATPKVIQFSCFFVSVMILLSMIIPGESHGL